MILIHVEKVGLAAYKPIEARIYSHYSPPIGFQRFSVFTPRPWQKWSNLTNIFFLSRLKLNHQLQPFSLLCVFTKRTVPAAKPAGSSRTCIGGQFCTSCMQPTSVFCHDFGEKVAAWHCRIGLSNRCWPTRLRTQWNRTPWLQDMASLRPERWTQVFENLASINSFSSEAF